MAKKKKGDDDSSETFGMSDAEIFDSLSVEARATLAKIASPDSQAAGLSLTPGGTRFDRMRHRSSLQDRVEKTFPDVRQLEAEAADTWAEHRARNSKRREELEEEIQLRHVAFVKGNPGALFDALMFSSYRDSCLFGAGGWHGEHWVGVPRWVINALVVFLSESISGLQVKPERKKMPWSSQWNQDRIDFERWKTVQRVRKRRVVFTDDKVYEVAAEELPPGCHCGAHAVKDSYLKVQRRLKTDPGRYLDLEYDRVLIRP